LRANAQDIHFSQFYENAILRNPALTGIFSGDYKAGVNYRTQWGNISNPFQTVMVSAETRMNVNKEQNDYLSFGFCTSYDHAGAIDFNSMQITPAINYNKSLNDQHASYLSVGFAASYIQRSVDPSKMTLDNQYIGGSYISTAPTGEHLAFSKISHYDVSAGVSFNSTIGEEAQVVYYIGGAAYHITKPRESFNPNESFIRLNAKYTGNFGLQARLTKEVGISVLANYTNQYPYQETVFGGFVNWRSTLSETKKFVLYAGCFMRVQDAIIPTFKLDYNTYSFTMSYDVTTSSLKPALSSKGGWEFSLYVRGKYNKRDNFMERLTCPKFEPGMLSEFEGGGY
jgi:type IX secretion system PorP/SprF family membrane protein